MAGCGGEGGEGEEEEEEVRGWGVHFGDMGWLVSTSDEMER